MMGFKERAFAPSVTVSLEEPESKLLTWCSLPVEQHEDGTTAVSTI